MKNFAFRVLMAAALLALAACMASCDMWFGGNGDSLFKVSDSGELSARDRYAVTGTIVIPEEIGGVAVTSIGSSAFWGCAGLASVAIPSSVTSIGGGAFIGCSALMSIGVDVGNADYRSEGGCLLSKDGTVFLACPGGLASVSVPSSVTSIGDEAFERCTGLASIEIPSSVTSIGKYAFLGCTGLASVSFAGTKSQWGAVRNDVNPKSWIIYLLCCFKFQPIFTWR